MNCYPASRPLGTPASRHFLSRFPPLSLPLPAPILPCSRLLSPPPPPVYYLIIFWLQFNVGVITYKPKSGECDRVCCNGPGGALTVEGSCSPTDKCAGIKPADKQETGHCPGESKDTCKCGSEGKIQMQAIIPTSLQ